MPRLKNWIDDNVSFPPGVTRTDEAFASVSHAVGFVLAFIASVLLVLQASGDSRALAASVIYGVAMCAVFGASSIYHGLKVSTGKRVFRLIDHSSIYILIAGTYTPYAAGIGGRAGTLLLIAIWSLCVIGLALNFLLWDRFRIVHIAVYLLMGWLILFFRKALFDSVPYGQIRWMFIGGALYTVGVFFYMYKKLHRSHFIWHLFVIGGAAGLHIGIAVYAIPSIMAGP